MKWWKVKTWADVTIESNWFGFKKRYTSHFVYKTKFIYAKNAEDARMKYGDLFFTPVEDGYDKDLLVLAGYYAEGISSNMNFNLPFNCKVVHTHEWIYVSQNEYINENINEIRLKSSADDFRDWFVNGTTYADMDKITDDVDDFDNILED